MESTLQDIFRVGFEAFAEGRRFPLHWRKAAWSFMHCRTAELGGHIQACPEGHVEWVWYNSCKPRSCPQCNPIPIERWLAFQPDFPTPCKDFHG